MKLIPIAALVLVLLAAGCKTRKPAEVKNAVPQDVVKAAIVDFARHIPNTGDTLYIAFGDQDPPATLLAEVQPSHVLILPASQKADSSLRTTFTLYPDSAAAADTVRLPIKWQVGRRGASGTVELVRQGDSTAVKWNWGSPFGS